MEDKGTRFWDAFWVVAPLVIGGLIGFYVVGQFPAPSGDCSQLPGPPSTTANYALAIVLVALLVGRVVARSTIGPVAARAFTVAAFGLVVSACGSYFVSVRSEPCPQAIASEHEAMVRVSPPQLHLSRQPS